MHPQSRRGRIEAAFERWTRGVLRQRWIAILGVLAVTAGLMSFLPQMRVDNSEENFLQGDDPARVLYDQFRDRFGRDELVILVVQPPELFDLEFLGKLRDFHRDIEENVPYVEEVTSLINARNTWGDADRLIVEDLMEEWPQNEAELAVLKERALSNPLFENILISENARYTTITVKPYSYSTLGPRGEELEGFEDEDADREFTPKYLSDVETRDLVEALKVIQARYEAPDFRIEQSGGPTFEVAMTVSLERDVRVFMAISIALTGILLFVLFRRVSGVVIPLFVVLTSLASTLGAMVWIGIPMSTTIQILPAFLLVVGVCDSIHILAIVYQRMSAGLGKNEAIVYAVGHSGLAVVMTSVTTAGGLASFFVAELAPISQLGIIAPIGVLLAMLYTLILLPPLLSLWPLRAQARSPKDHLANFLTRILVRVGDACAARPWTVVAATSLVLLLGLGGVLQARFSHDGLRWFPEEDPLRVGASLVDREFKGASTLDVVIDTGRENGLHDPDTLKRIERAMRFANNLEVASKPVNKSVSITDVVKETHQALNENRSNSYVLPDNRQVIAQELLLFENSGSDDLEDLTDSQFQLARVTIRVPWEDAFEYPALLEQIETGFASILGDGMNFHITGGVTIFTQVFQNVIISMARSYAIALVVITPMLVLLIGSLRRGLVGMIPNLVPVFLTIGLMGWFDIPLDASTLLIGGVVIGLAVDDTIHFMHKFNRYYDDLGDARAAVRETLATTGTALLFTTLVLASGFFVFLFAYMMNSFWFGLLCGFATIVAFLADVVLGPALMVLVTRWQERSAQRTRLRAAA